MSAWVEQSDTVHLKAVDEHGDPVELTAYDLKTLIDELSRLHAIITAGGSGDAGRGSPCQFHLRRSRHG